MNYEKRWITKYEYVIVERESSGRVKVIQENDKDYTSWLIAGNHPINVPYMEPDISEDEVSLDIVRSYKKKEINEAKWRHIGGGFNFNGVRIASDSQSRELLYGAVIHGIIDPSVVINWKVGEDQFVPLDINACRAAAIALEQNIEAAFTKERGLIEAINEAATVEEVMEIEWEVEQ